MDSKYLLSPLSQNYDSGMKLTVNPYSLRFKNGIEPLFRRDYFNSSIRFMRISFFASFLNYSSFVLLDILVLREYLQTLSIIRFAIVCPVILIVFGLSYTKNFYKYWQLSMSLAVIVGGSAITAMTTLDSNLARTSYYVGIILVLFYNYVMIKQRFVWSTFTGWFISITYLLSIHFYPFSSRETIIVNIFFLFSFNILGMFGSYLLEFCSRRDFNQRYLLQEERSKVEIANKELEQTVNEKTSELQKELKQRKKEEIELIAARDRAEQSDRLKSAFLANMSHEIRTPMNGIIGFTDLLNTPGLNDEERGEYVKIIQQSGHRMLDTINDLINVSKIEAGLIELNLNSENLNKILTDLFYFFQPEAKNKGLEFSLKNKLPAKFEIIHTDKEKINSILTNLIKNAIKYTPQGSIEFGFSISTEHITPVIEFRISDTGIGIPEDKTKVIFDRFIQADIDQDRAFDGAGLGLSITQSYVEMLGGKLWVESEENIGSSFYFSIPIRTGVHTDQYRRISQESQQTAIKWLSNKEVLIAEDDEISTVYLRNVLKDKCIKLHLAKNGMEAIDLLKTNPNIELILMDIKMPEMNGHKATEAIRKFNTNVIIIAQTAYAMKEDLIQSLASGCDEHVSKPSDEKSILTAIEEILQKRKKISGN